MCMILDNNKWGDFLKQKQDMKPIHYWLNNKNGKLIYSDHQGFSELSTRYQRSLQEYKRSGKANIIPKLKVEKEIKAIQNSNYTLKSNDIHILGLAKASSAKVLCTADRKLHKDFLEVISNGKIYQTADHEHLLTENICPSS